MVNLLPLFIYALKLKDKSKTVGVARRRLHFLCGDKENVSRRGLDAALGMSGASGRQHQFSQDCLDRNVYVSPAGAETLESLSDLWRIVVRLLMFCRLFPCRSHSKEGPLVHGPDLLITVRLLDSHRNLAKEMPSARRKALFAYFCRRRTKVRRLAGRELPV